jgi:hypothetical protein
MSIYSLCSSALSHSLSLPEVYAAQSVSCALLAASALLLCAASLFLFTRVPGGENFHQPHRHVAVLLRSERQRVAPRAGLLLQQG